MSGGFFRGTSADQDTRFSNKQAKLMKSQKFPPELEHLVDVTKVSMDVMRPWIANRVTELLGFEDEVLINFIYGLLDGKEVNGKEVQIQLTGFMEKNTGKFMKELWTLLLSARKNASGVPQQFLDAKQEETKKRKEEADWLANEIQRKKDKETQELEEERSKKMDGGIGKKASNGSLESNSKHTLSNASSDHSEDEKITDKRNGVRAINGTRSPSRSISKSHSNSRSDYGSRSVSRSLKECKRSVSFERVYYSPRRQSITPRWRRSPQGSFSPKRGRSSSFSLSLSPKRGRSRSFSLSLSPRHRRLPSPFRRHRLPSPFRRRRSPSPTRCRRSPSPTRCRRSPSPTRCRRSPSPTRCRRSPSHILHCRSPSLVRRRRLPSPMRHLISPLPVRYPVSRSPARRYISPSPMLRRRSPSPLRHNRSPSPVQHSRSPSAVQRYSLPSSVQRASCSPARGRSVSSPAPVRRRSPSLKRRSPSLERGSQRSPSTPQHGCVSHVGRRSPFTSDRRSTFGSGSLTPHKRCLSPMQRGSRSPLSRKSPEQKRSVQSPRERGRIRTNEKSPRVRQSSSSPMSRSPPRCRIASEDKSPYKSHVGQAKELMTWDASSSPPRKFRENRQSSEKEKRGNHKSKPMEKRLQNSTTSKQKDSALNVCYREYSPERFSTRGVVESRSDQNDVEIRSKDQEKKREKKETPRTPYLQKSPMMHKDSLPDERKHPPYPGADGKSVENRSYSKSMKGSSRHHKSEFLETSIECVHHSKHGSASDYGSEEMDKHKDADKELRKHKRSRREAASDDDHSYDSDTEDRKEAKRRMKEENRLQKEKKRQQREERCWKRLERRAEKQKGKNQNDVSASDGEDVSRMECYSEDTVSEQKRLETELRKKALESLKTKKGISH